MCLCTLCHCHKQQLMTKYSTLNTKLFYRVCVCMRVHACLSVCECNCMAIYLCFMCSCCNRFEADEARKSRVAVGSFLDLNENGCIYIITYTCIHTVAWFCTVYHAWLLYVESCTVMSVQSCMWCVMSSDAALLWALHVQTPRSHACVHTSLAVCSAAHVRSLCICKWQCMNRMAQADDVYFIN